MNLLFNMYLDSTTNIVLTIASILVLVIAIAILIFLINKKKKSEKSLLNQNNYTPNDVYLALGGKDNVVSHSINGSRLTLVLKDYKKVDRDALTKFGVERVLSMSNKYILVGEHLDKINEKLD
jgi:phosphotransferase system IIB component